MKEHKNNKKKAIELAKLADKKIKTNPKVGCVIVKDGLIIASGYHKEFGKEHAEVIAINNSKVDLSNSTLYVTLEPCCHYGKTPPCVDLIIKHKIKNVIIGEFDSNELVKNKSISILKKHNINVIVGILKDECHNLNKIYHYNQNYKLPYVKLKYAMSINGIINNFNSIYLTNDKSRKYVHEQRKIFDAIMVGVNTIINDNPMLNVRLQNTKEIDHPIRIICDTNLKTPLNSNLVKTAKLYKTIIATNSKDEKIINLFKEKNVEIMYIPKANNKINLNYLLKQLYQNWNISSIYLEGGANLNKSFIKNNLINEIDVFVAPKIIIRKNPKFPFGNDFSKNNEIQLSMKKIINLNDDILINYEVLK